MKTLNSKNKCRRIRTWLHNAISKRINLDTGWIQTHIANCPRCRQRLASVAKVYFALSVMKSQPHNLDLLMRANAQAISTLKHSLQQAPKTRKLKTMMPELKPLERCGKYARSTANVAACIIILLLMKIGVFSSMDKFQTEGQKAIKQYYANHIGKDLTDEIFTA